ncbi:uncharacterized protein MKK02DRAFT_21665, partial [Dioszegia hungarica]
DPTYKLVEQLVTSLRRRQTVGSLNVALATAVLIHTVVRSSKYANFEYLIGLIKLVGRQLAEANPKELASGNIIRRILRLIREEYRAAAHAASHIPTTPSTSAPQTPYTGIQTPGILAPAGHFLSDGSSSLAGFGLGMSNLTMSTSASPSSGRTPLFSPETSRVNSADDLNGANANASANKGFAAQLRKTGYETPTPGQMTARLDPEEFMRQSAKLKPVFLQAIEEVMGELETTHEDVAKGAREHVHSSEIILTLGYSRTVEAFLKTAFKDRKFTVIVAESAPSHLGHRLSHSLSQNGIPTLLIPDSSLHALMPRITKLVIGCHSVLANGGLFGLSGSLSAVLAARAHSKPVVVVTGQYKFAPVWNMNFEHGSLDFQGGSAFAASAGEGGREEGMGARNWEGVEVESAYWEYVRPELVDLFVTNEGDHAPSYIYKLIKEAYDEEDMDL